MLTYIALFRGPSISRARLLGLSTDADVVQRFAGELLQDARYTDAPDDPILRELHQGYNRALQFIAAGEEGHPK